MESILLFNDTWVGYEEDRFTYVYIYMYLYMLTMKYHAASSNNEIMQPFAPWVEI